MASLIIAIKIFAKLQQPMSDRQTSNTPNLVFLGLGALVFLWACLKNRTPSSQNNERILTQRMKQMREMLKNGKPTLELCRQALRLVFYFTMLKVEAHNSEMKKRRAETTDVKELLELLIIGVETGKIVVAKAKIEAYERLGVSSSSFAEFEPQLNGLRQEFRKEYLDKNREKELSLAEIRDILTQQARFFEQKGTFLARDIVRAAQSWPSEKREYVKLVIPLLIVDLAICGFPELHETELERAKRKYREELGQELANLESASQEFTDIIRRELCR